MLGVEGCTTCFLKLNSFLEFLIQPKVELPQHVAVTFTHLFIVWIFLSLWVMTQLFLDGTITVTPLNTNLELVEYYMPTFVDLNS